MTQKQKELLLKDLCARLPYGVICDIYNTHCTIKERLVFSGITRFVDDTICVRPYLFPLSSMTDEQEKEEYEICKGYIIGYESKLIDFYNKNHIDYRGLIPIGLALDATGLNIY